MGAINYDKMIKYEVQRESGTDYQVHSYRKDAQGEWQYLECFLCDFQGRVSEYEIWSDALQEFVYVDLNSKKRDYYKDMLSQLSDHLKIAIVEHANSKGVAL